MPSQFPKLKLEKDPGEIVRSRFLPATKHDLKKVYKLIMSLISDFAAKQTAFNDRLSAAIDGVAADVDSLNAKIAELSAVIDDGTPEQKAIVAELETKGEALASRLEAVDALTPPKPPTTPA